MTVLTLSAYQPMDDAVHWGHARPAVVTVLSQASQLCLMSLSTGDHWLHIVTEFTYW